MVGLKIGLDIGTGYVTAAVEGKGVVLCEPAVVALERETGSVIEAGSKAAEMTGRCPDAIKLVRPLLSGGVAELESSEKLLRAFLERICKNKIPKTQLFSEFCFFNLLDYYFSFEMFRLYSFAFPVTI